MDTPKKDIFISYKNDGSGNQFANRLFRDLEEMGYSVYFNPNEERAHSFPERIKQAIENCKDFILIISEGCLAQLKRNDAVDWVREEILIAHKLGKHFIPILMEGVKMPKNTGDMPPELQFLPHIDAIPFPEQYLYSPFSTLLEILKASRDGHERYKDSFNSNPQYNVHEDFCTILDTANSSYGLDIRSMYEIGMMYYYGVCNADGTEAIRDYEQAAYWLKRVSAHDENDIKGFTGTSNDISLISHAKSILARMYYQGVMPREPQSYEKAFQYHSEAAKYDAYSAADAGFMRRCGIGCEFDFQAILDYYNENIHHTDDMLTMELAAFLSKYGRYQEAIDLYNSMESSSPEADYRIGLLYRDGVLCDPPKPDHIRAAYYFRNAADNNHIQAAYEYGLLCFRPIGKMRKNFPLAEKYLKIAADGGLATAQYILGYMYKSGHVQKNLSLAIEYLEKARAQSHSLSALELALLYQQPECKNYRRAYECAKIAASHGVPEGELILGNLLFFGRGCEANMNKAYEMYDRAYQHGIYYAYVMMQKVEALLK